MQRDIETFNSHWLESGPLRQGGWPKKHVCETCFDRCAVRCSDAPSLARLTVYHSAQDCVALPSSHGVSIAWVSADTIDGDWQEFHFHITLLDSPCDAWQSRAKWQNRGGLYSDTQYWYTPIEERDLDEMRGAEHTLRRFVAVYKLQDLPLYRVGNIPLDPGFSLVSVGEKTA